MTFDMSNEGLTTGDLVSRYFERVLGLRQVESVPLESSSGKEFSTSSSTSPVKARKVCLLLEVGSDSDTPSVQEMGARLLDAIRNEWLKHSIDELPDIRWLRTDETTWRNAIADHEASLALAIVCGVHVSSKPDPRVVFVPGFSEMQNSHVLKREAWRAMQSNIARAAH